MPSRKNSSKKLKSESRSASESALAQVAASLQVGHREAPAVPPSAPSRTLDVFANPAPDRDYVITFDVPEFTCLCPLTGQPDFAHFKIQIVADQLCVETKSLKQYFWSYRNEGAFHEKVTNSILDDLVAALSPRLVKIEADWFVRGGIRTYVTTQYTQKGFQHTGPALL